MQEAEVTIHLAGDPLLFGYRRFLDRQRKNFRILTQVSRRPGCGLHETVNWSRIQPQLNIAPCDTLTVLNCGYHDTNDAALDTMNGTNEILAASDDESMAPALEHTLLGSLTEVLSRLAPSKTSIDAVKDELAKANTNTTDQPFHRRYPDSNQPSIQLQPLGHSIGGASRIASGEADPAFPDSSFYVRISLDSVENIPKAEWATFFANTTYPGNVHGLQFYTSESLLDHLRGLEAAATPRN